MGGVGEAEKDRAHYLLVMRMNILAMNMMKMNILAMNMMKILMRRGFN